MGTVRMPSLVRSTSKYATYVGPAKLSTDQDYFHAHKYRHARVR